MSDNVTTTKVLPASESTATGVDGITPGVRIVDTPLSLVEHKLIRRLRQLGNGAHLLTVLAGRDGVEAVIVWSGRSGCKVEHLS